MGRSNRITLADVAKEAGVSIQTASHVLAENPTVRLPESTRERVRVAAAKLGYVPNRMAQAIRGGKTKVIGVWMPIDRATMSFLYILNHLNTHARESHYDLMIMGLDRVAGLTPEGKLPLMWPVDGIISVDAGKAVQQFKALPQNSRVPVAILGFELVEKGDSVGWRVDAGTKLATQNLIAKGCKRIVHVTLDWVLNEFPNERRRRGYAEAMTEAGLEPEFLSVAGETSPFAERAVADYLESRPVPDAFTAFTDPLAIGAGRAVLAKGARIPEDCRIWGFGNYPESNDFVVPISTFEAPYDLIVGQAWEWLMDRIDNPDIPSRFTELDLRLIDRESTR